MSDIVIVVNPKAGQGKAFEALEAAIPAGMPVQLVRTEGAGDGERLAREWSGKGIQLLAAAGGDGTVREVATGLAASDDPPVLGVIPMGTGNDLARSLGIPQEVEAALAVLSEGRDRVFDLVRATFDGGEPFVYANAATGGFSGRVHDALASEVKALWGPLSYLRSAVDTVGEQESWHLRIEIDGREHELDALNVVIANGRFAGGGIPIAPHADPFDGLLDLAVVLQAPMLRLTRLLPSLLKGEDPGDDLFLTERGCLIELEADRTLPLSVDGEQTEARRARFELVPGALRVRVPAPGLISRAGVLQPGRVAAPG